MSETHYERLHEALTHFAREEGFLQEGWFLGDYVVSLSVISPEEENQGMTGYLTINPKHQSPHTTLGLLVHAANRMDHNMNSDMDEE